MKFVDVIGFCPPTAPFLITVVSIGALFFSVVACIPQFCRKKTPKKTSTGLQSRLSDKDNSYYRVPQQPYATVHPGISPLPQPQLSSKPSSSDAPESNAPFDSQQQLSSSAVQPESDVVKKASASADAIIKVKWSADRREEMNPKAEDKQEEGAKNGGEDEKENEEEVPKKNKSKKSNKMNKSKKSHRSKKSRKKRSKRSKGKKKRDEEGSDESGSEGGSSKKNKKTSHNEIESNPDVEGADWMKASKIADDLMKVTLNPMPPESNNNELPGSKDKMKRKPKVFELSEKEAKIARGQLRNRNEYPTMNDVKSDWDSKDEEKENDQDEEKDRLKRDKDRHRRKEEKAQVEKETRLREESERRGEDEIRKKEEDLRGQKENAKAKDAEEKPFREEIQLKVKQEIEKKVREETEKKLREEAERKVAEEEDAKNIQAERKATEDAPERAKDDAGKAKETERRVKEESERKARDAERKAQREACDEASRKDREEERLKRVEESLKKLKPRALPMDAKAERIARGQKKRRDDYPTMNDVKSDWDSAEEMKKAKERKLDRT